MSGKGDRDMTCGECVYFKERPSLSKPPIVQIGDCICPSPNIPAFIIKRCPIYGFIDATDCPCYKKRDKKPSNTQGN